MSDPGSGYPLAQQIETTVETLEMQRLWAEAKIAEYENQLVGAQCALKELESIKKKNIQRNILAITQSLETAKRLKLQIEDKIKGGEK